MKQFLILYPIYVSLLLFALFFHHNILSDSFNAFQREILLTMLSWWFGERVVGHYVYINAYYSLVIDRSCSGVVSLALFWASIMAYRAKWLYKLLWIAIGYTVLVVANYLRIVFVVYMVMDNPKHFEWSHDYVGNGLFVLMGLLLFVSFLHYQNKQ
ncbi:MAG: hypothetical protein JXQ76_13205 [Campylobacterales bacterium]|nr:hypothetical protein [Campylobacterales bacterium]